MNILTAVILGIVQGIAEFLPISSSGHLVVLERVFGINEPTLTFDIVVHLGSLTAVIVVFWQDIWTLLRKPFQKMTGLLLVGTIPAVVVGFLFKSQIETLFRNSLLLAAAFVVTGVLLFIADQFKEGRKTEKDITYLDALLIGCMQAVGLPPGVSRSGATITGALTRGLTRETAARFSFLLSIIAITGAGVLQLKDIVQEHAVVASADILPLAFGFVASALVGYLAIRLLLRLINACKLRYFSYYVFALAALLVMDTLVTKVFF